MANNAKIEDLLKRIRVALEDCTHFESSILNPIVEDGYIQIGTDTDKVAHFERGVVTVWTVAISRKPTTTESIRMLSGPPVNTNEATLDSWLEKNIPEEQRADPDWKIKAKASIFPRS